MKFRSAPTFGTVPHASLVINAFRSYTSHVPGTSLEGGQIQFSVTVGGKLPDRNMEAKGTCLIKGVGEHGVPHLPLSVPLNFTWFEAKKLHDP